MPTVYINGTDEPRPEFARSAIAIGNFDGVHRGHRVLIDATIRNAKAVGGPAVVVTFDPPPYQVLFPKSPSRPPLTSLEQRARLMHDAGADHVAILRTTTELLALTPEAFFHDVIRKQLGAQAVIEGFNFRFGCNRTGNTSTLRRLCLASEIRFEEVSPFELQGESVSSSRVRAALTDGNVSLAAELLGRNYSLKGTVVAGAQRGRTLGFPTANLADVPTVLPGNGVYAVRATVGSPHSPSAGEIENLKRPALGECGLPTRTTWSAAANVGPNPTFGEHARKVEVHIIGFTGDLYGSIFEVEFVEKLRDTRPFAGIAELTAQLKQDVERAKHCCGTVS